ncbi:N-acetylglucosamine-6-phosphate deacetylase [Devosia sp. RR2S18]|uniref:N-acetylglucosamine-6-phosphate deacetylase n=1 Tax=Devosia rhizosphaerae TaxID=3049774 RepID=UPI002540855D|nr:N-acetylglucosamine-6-phosphate deacetylase [Devosia sp. RR2S18]WIJ24121.1 N-acetylglucosamine-6-phosphate deacetylase [Devosia sp. RR2S18]
MSDLLAVVAPRIFDGFEWHDNAALLIEFGHVAAIVHSDAVPARSETVHLEGGFVAPGFVDLQVNGGGGVLFNNDPSLSAIRTIIAAHAQFGTTALLPTLITDSVEINTAAIAAGKAAAEQALPGFLGLHLEGPHLSLPRKGTHDPALIRPMTDADLDRLVAARQVLPNLLCTVASETVDSQQISALAGAGIIVSLGHSDATHATASAAFEAGATMTTHLFNAMSQLGSREPGVVGATLAHPTIYAGLIADGIHVHPASIQVALAAKGAEHIFLVTDSMSQTGTDIAELTLNGRTITRADGALRLADGTLAGADLDMIDAVEFMHSHMGLPLETALNMASLVPSRALGIDAQHGHLRPGARANFVQLSPGREVRTTWINGKKVWSTN